MTGNRLPVLGRVGLHDAAKLRIFLGSPFGCGRAPFGFACRATADQRPLAPGSYRQGGGGSCHRRSVGNARRTARQHWRGTVNNKGRAVYWLFGCMHVCAKPQAKNSSASPLACMHHQAKNRSWGGQRAFFEYFAFQMTPKQSDVYVIDSLDSDKQGRFLSRVVPSCPPCLVDLR